MGLAHLLILHIRFVRTTLFTRFLAPYKQNALSKCTRAMSCLSSCHNEARSLIHRMVCESSKSDYYSCFACRQKYHIKYLIFNMLFFDVEVCGYPHSTYTSKWSRRRPVYPQSYPQTLWIAGKSFMKPGFSKLSSAQAQVLVQLQ